MNVKSKLIYFSCITERFTFEHWHNFPSTRPNSSKKTNVYIDCSALFETARQYASVKFSLTGNIFTEGQSKACLIHDQYFNLKLLYLNRVLIKLIYPNTELNGSEFLYDKCVKNLENIVSLRCSKTVTRSVAFIAVCTFESFGLGAF